MLSCQTCSTIEPVFNMLHVPFRNIWLEFSYSLFAVVYWLLVLLFKFLSTLCRVNPIVLSWQVELFYVRGSLLRDVPPPRGFYCDAWFFSRIIWEKVWKQQTKEWFSGHKLQPHFLHDAASPSSETNCLHFGSNSRFPRPSHFSGENPRISSFKPP